MKKLSSILILSLFLGLSLCFAGPALAKDAPDTIKLGCVLSKTGNLSIGGQWLSSGYDIAIKHINDNGGVYVKEFDKKIPLEIICLDNESDPRKTSTRMEKLYSVDKVDFFLGGYAAFLIIPQLAIAEKYEIPIVITSMGSSAELDKGYEYVFSPFMVEKDQVMVFLDILDAIPEVDRPTKIAYFQIQEEWGVATGDYLRQEAPKRGYEIVCFEKFAVGSNDFSSMINTAKRSGAEVLYSLPMPPQGIRMVKQMKEMNWTPKLTYFLRAAEASMWPANMGADGDYIIYTGGWDYHMQFPGVERLNADYAAMHNGATPPPLVGTGYACVEIMASAIEKAGTLDRQAVRHALAATDIETVMGPMQFDERGLGTGKYRRVAGQWQNGKAELIWPLDQASAPIQYPAKPFTER